MNAVDAGMVPSIIARDRDCLEQTIAAGSPRRRGDRTRDQREVPPALKVNFAKARKSFEEFDITWDSVEDLVKARSADAYTAIEKGMIDIEKSLMPDKPDVAQATALVQGVMTKYNEIVAQVTREARAAK
jgi:hypothetical protein